MYERLLKLIKQYLPEDKVALATPEARLTADLGMDSIGMLMLSMALEDEFGVSFNAPVNFVTVKDVVDYLEKNATKR
ncbi:MAG: acyl carrier protein [Bacteroidales bacterium]|jgi:acyl carrier protein|nr:acyl carrier protein [Bacteroidales bacterium]